VGDHPKRRTEERAEPVEHALLALTCGCRQFCDLTQELQDLPNVNHVKFV
jgi:hypothetical protein